MPENQDLSYGFIIFGSFVSISPGIHQRLYLVSELCVPDQSTPVYRMIEPQR